MTNLFVALNLIKPRSFIVSDVVALVKLDTSMYVVCHRDRCRTRLVFILIA